MEQKVLPIKDSNVLTKVQQCLLEDFKAGIRNYTIFQVGKATLLCVSDILRLTRADVFDDQGMCIRMLFSTTTRRARLTVYSYNPLLAIYWPIKTGSSKQI